MKAGKEHQDMLHSLYEAKHVLAVISNLDSRPCVLATVYRVAIYVILDLRVCLLFQRFQPTIGRREDGGVVRSRGSSKTREGKA